MKWIIFKKKINSGYASNPAQFLCRGVYHGKEYVWQNKSMYDTNGRLIRFDTKQEAESFIESLEIERFRYEAITDEGM